MLFRFQFIMIVSLSPSPKSSTTSEQDHRHITHLIITLFPPLSFLIQEPREQQDKGLAGSAMGAFSKMKNCPFSGAFMGGATTILVVMAVKKFLSYTGLTGKKDRLKSVEGPAIPVNSKPRRDGFRMPAEWEEHEG